ncbi:MAG: serine/threonine-protein kinase [Aphanizomenon gracile PMC649.10]|jgi:serine/threonine protein kinase|nr:serine/threonine-protein kinase [Aphanizomenon gracile PMC649.10]
MTTLLSRYKIIKQIGEGAFGYTYLAEDTALPGSPHCVVKHLKQNPDPSVLAIAKRFFKDEAEVLQNLGKHDQIPSLAAYFEEKGEFYLVQEFVDGYDLNQEIISGTNWSEEQTIKLLIDILEILAVVHKQNIIHRDIKPSNIMRRRQDDKIVLIDFGAVKEIGVYTVNSKGQTSLTVGIGTPGYMPNEQANGRPKFASDIYAVGMIGIQAVTGLVPGQFQEDSNTGEIIWRNHAQVSDRFAQVLTKMVRDHFRDRYQNATEALQALIPPTKTVQVTPSPSPPIKTAKTVQVPPSSPTKTVRVSPPHSTREFPTKILAGLGVALAITFLSGVVDYVTKLISLDQNSPIVSSTSQPTSSPKIYPTESSTPQPNINILRKNSKIDFRNLEKLLAAKKWKEADQETWELMQKITNRKIYGWLRKEDYQNFPREELHIMDELWVKHSNGLFGFSVQKTIWINLGGTPGVYNYDIRSQFNTKVEWTGLAWQLKAYTIPADDLGFFEVRKGQLPWGGYRDSMGVIEVRKEPKDSMRSEEFYLSFLLPKL